MSELLNTFITQFNNMYTEENMEREADIDDIDNMSTLIGLLGMAFYQKRITDALVKLETMRGGLPKSKTIAVSKRKFGRKHP